MHFGRSMLRQGELTLFRVRGIPIRAHWSLLLALPYLAWVFSTHFASVAQLANVDPAALRLPPLAWGALLAIGLFASVALHELAHSLVAIRWGGRVQEITLMLIGGVSRMERIPRRPKQEALMAAAGPAASLALAFVLASLHQVLPHRAADLSMGLFYLAEINLSLGLFNLLPAFPMDGGRVLRALLAQRLGGARATRIATAVGQVAAVLFGLLGLWSGNLILVLIAVFLYSGAGAEARAEKFREAIGGLTVGDLMVPNPPVVSLEAGAADALANMRSAGRMELVAITSEGRPVGVVRAADLFALAPTQTLRDLGERLTASTVVAQWSEPASDALDHATEASADYVVAVDPARGGALVGLLGRRELENALALRALQQRAAEKHRPLGPPRPAL